MGHRVPLVRVELERDALLLTWPDGNRRLVALNGARVAVRDATACQRFVRHLAIIGQHGRTDLITPPERGTIAPRAAGLPGVPEDAAVVESGEWETVADWVNGGGRPGGRTVADLARLACIATSQFAITLGEWAAQVAHEMTWERQGPMRSGAGLRHSLRPLEEAAARSARAGEALVAALSRTAVFSGLPR